MKPLILPDDFLAAGALQRTLYLFVYYDATNVHSL